MIRRLWHRYMADIDEYEQAARATGDELLLALVRQFKFNRIFALCMAGVMLALSTAMLWRQL
jgi:hypothetical protein